MTRLARLFRRKSTRASGLVLAVPLLAVLVLPAGCANQPRLVITYSVATIGPVHTRASVLANAARIAYTDGRGWSMYGKIQFKQVPSGGNFTLWLATPDWVPRFSPICSSAYSCSVGRNVIINEARFNYATPGYQWPLSLGSYQTMVINHETGHWLGLGHRYCGGYGQLAPVMQQQTISLQGCRANPWPTPPEIQAVAAKLGIY